MDEPRTKAEMMCQYYVRGRAEKEDAALVQAKVNNSEMRFIRERHRTSCEARTYEKKSYCR